MSEKIKLQSMAFGALRILWKLVLVFLELIISVACDSSSKPFYTATQAQELYDEGLISIAEHNKSLHPKNSG